MQELFPQMISFFWLPSFLGGRRLVLFLLTCVFIPGLCLSEKEDDCAGTAFVWGRLSIHQSSVSELQNSFQQHGPLEFPICGEGPLCKQK